MTLAQSLAFLALLAACAGLGRLGAAFVVVRADRYGLVAGVTARSSHTRPTPTGGGVGFVLAGAAAGLGLLSSGPLGFAAAALAGGLALAVVGYLDDRAELSARIRLVVQILVVAALLAALWPLTPLAAPLAGAPTAAILALAGVWWINLFNFMDGTDGIAGQQAVFLLGAGGALAVAGGADPFEPALLWAAAVAAGAIGFLTLNWPPARVFMGDVGSTWLAATVFAVALWSVEAGVVGHAAWAILGAAFIADATLTLLTRMATGQRWAAAHRSHAYQILSRRLAGGHRAVAVLWIGVNALWLAPLAVLAETLPERAWPLVALAYAPLLIAAAALGAGRPDATREVQRG